jgi:hypothetical protein
MVIALNGWISFSFKKKHKKKRGQATLIHHSCHHSRPNLFSVFPMAYSGIPFFFLVSTLGPCEPGLEPKKLMGLVCSFTPHACMLMLVINWHLAAGASPIGTPSNTSLRSTNHHLRWCPFVCSDDWVCKIKNTS